MWLSDSSLLSTVLRLEEEIKVCLNHAAQQGPGTPSLWFVSLAVYIHARLERWVFFLLYLVVSSRLHVFALLF